MTYAQIFNIIVIPLVSFIITYTILYLLLTQIVPKFRNIKLRFRIALLTGLSHLILITLLCIVVAVSIKNEPEAGMFIFYHVQIYDFIFLGYFIWLNHILSGLSFNTISVIGPFIAFGILGSLTYACLGLIIGRIVEYNNGR